MKQLELLKQELAMLQENIKRIESFRKEHEHEKDPPSVSLVVGELRHRMVALKQRLTLVSKISTWDLFH